MVEDGTSRRELATEPHRHGADLEELVAQRTAELLTAYEWLEQEFAARCLTDQALQKSEERFRALAEQSPASIFISRGSRFVYTNPHFERTMGYSREELCAPEFNFLDLVAPECHDVVRKNHARHLAGEEVPPYDCTVLARDGRRMTVAIRTTLIGEEKDLLGVAIDITERVQAELQRREYAHRLVGLREEERRRVAGELHDLIGPNLTLLGIHLSLALQSLPQSAGEAAESRLRDSLRLLEQVTRQMREIMAELRPPMLDDYGLAATLHWYAGQLSRTIEPPVVVTVEGHPSRMAVGVEAVLFRIAQEALLNAVKHAGATSIAVFLSFSPCAVLLMVEDDGRGFVLGNTPEEAHVPHWGLVHMRECADTVQGRFSVDSSPGKGTRIAVRLSPGIPR